MRTKILVFGMLLGLIASCTKENLSDSKISKFGTVFQTADDNLPAVTQNYSEKDIKQLIRNNSTKASSAIKITFTWGGTSSPGQGGNNPCQGCFHCGCCLGLCVELRKGMLVSDDHVLTDQEISEGWGIFNMVNLVDSHEIMLIPSQNVDNGTGYLNVDDDIMFSDEINDYFDEVIVLEGGAYRINSVNGYPFGVIIINKK
jgi:hypothetical protein